MPQDDWTVVEEALNFGTADFDGHGALARLRERIKAEAAEARELADEVARLRKREAQDARKIEAYDNARSVVKTEGNTRAYYVLRAEAAEAAVWEMSRKVNAAEARVAELETLKAERELLRARVAELEEALREIADYFDQNCREGEFGYQAVLAARRALAYEEEKA